jgi:hypothetical protein
MELKNGLERMKFRDDDFHDSRHMRLKVLTELQEKGLLNEKLQWIIPA